MILKMLLSYISLFYGASMHNSSFSQEYLLYFKKIWRSAEQIGQAEMKIYSKRIKKMHLL